MNDLMQQQLVTEPTSKLALGTTHAAVQDFSEPAKAFLLEEQRQRRTEIENLIARVEGDQRYGLLATGLIWSWLVTNQAHVKAPFDLFVGVIPAIVMCFFMLRWLALDASIRRMASYTRKLEELFGLPSDVGWERYLAKIRGAERKNDELRLFAWGYWILLLATNSVLGGVFVWIIRRSG